MTFNVITTKKQNTTVKFLNIVSQNAPDSILAHIHFKKFPGGMSLDPASKLVIFGRSGCLPQNDKSYGQNPDYPCLSVTCFVYLHFVSHLCEFSRLEFYLSPFYHVFIAFSRNFLFCINCNFLSHVFFLQLVFVLRIQLIHVLGLRMTFWSCVRCEEDFRSRVRLENDYLVVR